MVKPSSITCVDVLVDGDAKSIRFPGDIRKKAPFANFTVLSFLLLTFGKDSLLLVASFTATESGGEGAIRFNGSSSACTCGGATHISDSTKSGKTHRTALLITWWLETGEWYLFFIRFLMVNDLKGPQRGK
jgi:hypothetical protein